MDTVILYADSKNRDSNAYPSGASYTLHLTNPIKNVSQVDLVSAKVPNTLWNLTNGTAVLTFNSTIMNLTPGFYSACSLLTEITARMPAGANVSWSGAEGKFFFWSPAPFTVSVSNFGTKLLGLSTGVKNAVAVSTSSALSQVLPGGYYLKSSSIADFSTNEFLFLDIQELRTPGTAAALAMKTDGSGTFTGINARNSFAMVPLNVNSGAVKSFSEGGDFRLEAKFPHPIDTISRLTITWTDETGQPVNFQGMDNNSFILRLHIAEKEKPPPPPPVTMVELRRILDDMITVKKPKESDVKRPLVGRWTLIIFLVILAGGYLIYKATRPVAAVLMPRPPLSG